MKRCRCCFALVMCYAPLTRLSAAPFSPRKHHGAISVLKKDLLTAGNFNRRNIFLQDLELENSQGQQGNQFSFNKTCNALTIRGGDDDRPDSNSWDHGCDDDRPKSNSWDDSCNDLFLLSLFSYSTDWKLSYHCSKLMFTAEVLGRLTRFAAKNFMYFVFFARGCALKKNNSKRVAEKDDSLLPLFGFVRDRVVFALALFATRVLLRKEARLFVCPDWLQLVASFLLYMLGNNIGPEYDSMHDDDIETDDDLEDLLNKVEGLRRQPDRL